MTEHPHSAAERESRSSAQSLGLPPRTACPRGAGRASGCLCCSDSDFSLSHVFSPRGLALSVPDDPDGISPVAGLGDGGKYTEQEQGPWMLGREGHEP